MPSSSCSSVEAATDESTWPYEPVVDRGYLRPTRLTRAEGSVAELWPAGGDPNVASLCERVHCSLEYEWGITGVGTTASEALAAGRGVCQDYAHIMLAACRAAGIPARYVSGHLGGEGGSHAWVEVLYPHPYCGEPLGRPGLGSHPQPPGQLRLSRGRGWA